MGKKKGVHTGVGKFEGKRPLEDLVLDGTIIFKCIFTISAWNVDWIDLAQGSEMRWVVVEAAVSLGFNKTREIS